MTWPKAADPMGEAPDTKRLKILISAYACEPGEGSTCRAGPAGGSEVHAELDSTTTFGSSLATPLSDGCIERSDSMSPTT